MVEVEGLAVDRAAGAAGWGAGPLGAVGVPGLGLVAVPGVGVAHVGAGAEDPALAPQEHDLDVVVERDVVQVGPELLAHLRVVGVPPLGVVEADAGDACLQVSLDQHTVVAHEDFLSGCRDPLEILGYNI